ncbi:TauD/TfdA family dioxygenase [Actinomadura sp. 9N215]|uniref:TauD/TfdA family dioxygenase n=1 Tax=Actinomadura sp. 9N215 TaxID=3375150 RepID=UPI00378E6D74
MSAPPTLAAQSEGAAAAGPPVVQLNAADPHAQAEAHRAELRAMVREHGAVLVRGLRIADAEDARLACSAIGVEPVTEREGFAPRSVLGDRIYSSLEWPPDQPMCMHHELSYADTVPSLLIVMCLVAPAGGGETALADATEVLAALPAELTEEFARTGWLLERNYHATLGMTWQQAFGTEDPQGVERYCLAHGVDVEWRADGGLRTRQRRDAIVRHPRTGARCWFNQIAFCNRWTLDPDVRAYLTMEFGDRGLPFDTFYGDGRPLTPGTVETINAAYDAHTRRVPWRAGDIMIIDNIRTAHNREPYRGDRRMAVILADPIRPVPGGVGGRPPTGDRTGR